MNRPLAPGDVIHGFAHGAFGRDHYHCVRIETVGPDWIVARHPDHGPSFTCGRQSLELCQEARDMSCEDSYGNPCQLLDGDTPLTTWPAQHGQTTS
ncbi:hypothetical protein ACFWV1_13050 [Streptomyces sp. NPDC058700]|uniref:hypothetical protein n=1 Tax=Streptomyces sp. NPDC058700 TaxID=3346607 RepID=UPI0036620C73